MQKQHDVDTYVVMVSEPIHCALKICVCLLDVLLEPPQNLQIELLLIGCLIWRNRLQVLNTFAIEETNQHCLIVQIHLARFFWISRMAKLVLGLGLGPIALVLITS